MASQAEHQPRPLKYAPWRAATLAGVYLLMGVHIAHWKLNGTTLAPLELNEVMYTLELGIITAGFIFMAVAAVSVLIVGRFFCSWGCHILALEDLSLWILNKLGIKPRPVRSRLLLLIPFSVLFYMFGWPQIMRVMAEEPLPQWRIVRDAEGWTSFSTTDFWRNLPGPWVIGLTFFLCGFAIIYFLGSRSFCKYACPYGAAFGLLDRFSPGQIVAGDNCDQCGRCTAVCGSDIRVHEELDRFGKVIDPDCLKDLDCVSVCPNESVHFGFTTPSLFTSWKRRARLKQFDFSWPEEVLMLVVFLCALLIFRGLYDKMPFLMTLGLGVILAYFVVICWRLPRAASLSFGPIQLKRAGGVTRAGIVFACVAGLVFVLIGHSGFIRYHETRGQQAFNAFMAGRGPSPGEAVPMPASTAMGHFEAVDQWGMVRSVAHNSRMARLSLLTYQDERAQTYLQRLQTSDPATAHELVGNVRFSQGDIQAAKNAYALALKQDPDRFQPHMELSGILANEGLFAEAAAHLEQALVLAPDSHRAHYNLAVVLTQLGRTYKAIDHYRAAAILVPGDPEVHNNLGFLLEESGELDEAVACYLRAIELNPNYANPHFNLGRTFMRLVQPLEAQQHFQIAARLDPEYATLLEEMGITF